ncbi:Peptidase-M10 domain-containing protein [Fusarium keratoplasticum]|uniref:Peptidase-M10 domain-containing protein n=1 Tax=Fusarium keratoplasticum TaxID=1328300 RepID=A0ACC0RFU0_9HYPO|nr:Peptidase-M10 domain-containing protein [Fusarium keratoplasticum]KAI8685014.1 Peptidase-M10 domain-containing protein [Fusarium keratoplasticum]KAI8689122.1 Peptidase-M10 domain-containing protein [Fusarium keratoplasticum]
MELAIVAEVWNKVEVGVTFEWVHLATDATFLLSRAGKGGRTPAMSFFPNSADLNSTPPISDIKAEGQGAVPLGVRDPKSVMTYAPEPPEMQQSNLNSTKMFYVLRPNEN